MAEPFRCHQCGQLVCASDANDVYAVAPPEPGRSSPGAAEPGPRKKRLRKDLARLSFGYNALTLWVGAAFFGCLGLVGLGVAIFALAGGAARPPGSTPANPLTVFICPALSLLPFALLGLLAFFQSERFTVDHRGITWRKGGRRGRLAWDEIAGVRLAGSTIVVVGPPDTRPLEISANYEQSDELLEWLSRCAPAKPAAPDADRPDAAPTDPTQPLVHRNSRIVLGAVVTALLALLGLGVWTTLHGLEVVRQGKDTANWPTTQGVITRVEVIKQRKSSHVEIAYTFSVDGRRYASDKVWLGQGLLDESYKDTYPQGKSVTVYHDPDDPSWAVLEPGKANYIWLIFGLVLVLIPVGLFGLVAYAWDTQFRVDADGIEWRSLLRKRRYAWDELWSVRVRVLRTEVKNYGRTVSRSFENVLVVTPAEGGPITLKLGDASFPFRDAIVARAKQAGVELHTN
jgi:hypothetical protein